MRQTLILFALPFLFLTCTPPKSGQTPDTEKYKYEYAEIDMRKTPCYGRCPEYQIKIQGNGQATYEGKRFVEKVGKYQKTLDAKTTNALFDTFEKADFWQFKNEYTEPITDLPTTYITYVMTDMVKEIKDYAGGPEALHQLEQLVEDIAFSKGGWKKVD